MSGLTTTTRRAVLCADGQIHYGPDYLAGMDPAKVIAAADARNREPRYCGGGPHFLAEQTITVSDWSPVTLGDAS